MMSPDKPEPSIADFKSVAEAGAIRSKLGRWLATNRDEFADMLRIYRPRWDALIEKFIAEGLMQAPVGWPDDDRARKRAVDAVRQIWRRTKLKSAIVRQTTPAERQPASNPGWIETAQPQSIQDESPRARKRLVLRSPKPLAEDEPWPDDGSKLPKPLRNH